MHINLIKYVIINFNWIFVYAKFTQLIHLHIL